MDDIQRQQSGFSLVELLVVIVVIMILMTGLVLVATGSKLKARVEKTKAIIQKMETGLATYHSKYKKYPPKDAANSSKPLHQYLGHPLKEIVTFRSGGNHITRDVPPILEITDGEVIGGDTSVKYAAIADSFGQGLIYINPGANRSAKGFANHRKYVDIWSRGWIDEDTGVRMRIENWNLDGK